MRTTKRTIKRSRKSEVRIVTREEELQIVALLRSPEISQTKPYYSDVADLVEMMIDTGMRLMEAIDLRYSDIDLERKMILVRATKSDPRRVPMTNRVAAIMQRRQQVDTLKPFSLSDMQLHIAWNWAKDKAGLKGDKGLALYALRRTCGYRLFTAGIDMEIAHAWLGYRLPYPKWSLAPLPSHLLTKAAEILDRFNHYITSK